MPLNDEETYEDVSQVTGAHCLLIFAQNAGLVLCQCLFY